MKRYLVLVLFVFALVAAPLISSVSAADNGNNGNHNGWYKNGRASNVGVPDAATTLSLLMVGMTAVGAYSVLLRRKHDK